ncbi:hypothetical protein AB0F09_19325 [Streptomyces olivaceus]|uniref:hypothetical protein n=1 Tax=Streptomyces olivaceus TaxID=47716 RepID=UPI0033C3FFF8
MSGSIVVRVLLGAYDYMHPSEQHTQVVVQIPGLAAASWMLPEDHFPFSKSEPWPSVVDSAQEHYVQRRTGTGSTSDTARLAVIEWLREDANHDAMYAAWEQDQARRHPVARKLLKDNEELRARVAKLETALAATGRSLSSFIFDADDPGADALGAQWLYWQAMPLVDDPFVQARMFRSSVFSEASKAAEAMDTGGPSDRGRPQAYLDGYSDGVQDVAERLEKLADQAAEGTEVAS